MSWKFLETIFNVTYTCYTSLTIIIRYNFHSPMKNVQTKYWKETNDKNHINKSIVWIASTISNFKTKVTRSSPQNCFRNISFSFHAKICIRTKKVACKQVLFVFLTKNVHHSPETFHIPKKPVSASNISKHKAAFSSGSSPSVSTSLKSSFDVLRRGKRPSPGIPGRVFPAGSCYYGARRSSGFGIGIGRYVNRKEREPFCPSVSKKVAGFGRRLLAYLTGAFYWRMTRESWSIIH